MKETLLKHKHWSIFIQLLMGISTVLSACTTPKLTSVPTETAVIEAFTQVPLTAAPKPGVDKQGGTLVMGFDREPEILNPYIRTQTVADIAGRLFERGLLKVVLDGTFVPDLAKQVPTIENGGVSEDGLTITYNLKENIVWSDGDPFDCQDVVFTWEAIMHPDSGAVSTSGYQDMESVTCDGDYTVVVKYSKFYAPYLTRFPAIFPSHIGLEPAKMTEWAYNRNPVSLGPFILAEWVPGDYMTAVRNEKYDKWETEGKPYLEAIVLRWLESREQGKGLIQTGQLDLLWNLSEADLPEVEKWEGVVISASANARTERLLLNLRDPNLDAPCKEIMEKEGLWHWALGDTRVREAIELGINKQAIVDELLYAYAAVSTTGLILGWPKANALPSEFNPEKAQALLEEAGWKDTDRDGVRECQGCLCAEEGRVLRLKIQTISGDRLREQVEQRLVEMMKEIGIELYVENVPGPEFLASYTSGAFRSHGQFDILLYFVSYGVDPRGYAYSYFSSDSIPCDGNSGRGFNYPRWIDGEADAALEIAGSSPDLQVRAEAYQKLAERIADGRPHIYLYNYMDIDLLTEDLMDYDMNVWSALTWNADEWWFKK